MAANQLCVCVIINKHSFEFNFFFFLIYVFGSCLSGVSDAAGPARKLPKESKRGGQENRAEELCGRQGSRPSGAPRPQ